jgi:hypothetical protein
MRIDSTVREANVPEGDAFAASPHTSPTGRRYCDRCDLLLGLNGVHVIAVEVSGGGCLRVVVETPASPMGCRECGSSPVLAGLADPRLP